MLSRSVIKLFKSAKVFPARGIVNNAGPSIVSVASWQKEKEAFENTLPVFINDIVSEKIVADVPLAAERLRDVLEYTLQGGKRNRPLFLTFAYKMLAKPEDLTPENLEICQLLGWFLEMIQSGGSILDDIMDGSQTRRGLPCWHQLPGVGVHAVNDACMMHLAILVLLKRRIGDKSYYMDVVDASHQCLFQAMIGQHIDMKTKSEKINYEMFTTDLHKLTSKLKAGIYTFGMPICWVLYMTNCYDEGRHQQVLDIAGELGYIYQLQNDYLDCYGEAETGKAGSDIQNGSPTWLAIKALELADPAQRDMFKSCYGSKQPKHIDRVKRLYEELELPRVLREEERVGCEKALKMSQLMPREFTPLYATILDKIYKRRV